MIITLVLLRLSTQWSMGMSSFRHGPTVRNFRPFSICRSEYRWCPGIDQKLCSNLIAKGHIIPQTDWWTSPKSICRICLISWDHRWKYPQHTKFGWSSSSRWFDTLILNGACPINQSDSQINVLSRLSIEICSKMLYIYEDEKIKEHNESSFFFGMIIKYQILKKHLIRLMRWSTWSIVESNRFMYAWCFSEEPQFSSVN